MANLGMTSPAAKLAILFLVNRCVQRHSLFIRACIAQFWKQPLHTELAALILIGNYHFITSQDKEPR